MIGEDPKNKPVPADFHILWRSRVESAANDDPARKYP
jgi:hypothetical protein